MALSEDLVVPCERVRDRAQMDMLLRLIRDLPGSIDYLRDHRAV